MFVSINILFIYSVNYSYNIQLDAIFFISYIVVVSFIGGRKPEYQEKIPVLPPVTTPLDEKPGCPYLKYVVFLQIVLI
jgi:hypothetical protein